MSRLQRNIIIVVLSGLCIILLLWIPSSQPNTDENVKNLESIHVEITLNRDENSHDNNEHRKQKLETINNAIEDDVGKSDHQSNDDDVGAVGLANNVIDNIENVQNGQNGVLESGGTERLKIFNGPQNDKQRAVVAAARHAWSAYKKFAWGHDNLKPITKSPHDWFGLGLTIVDSLDTLYIMGMEEEFEEARNWVEKELKLDADRDINLFEVTIRVLGGLLSAYHLSGDKMFLTKAVSFAHKLIKMK